MYIHTHTQTHLGEALKALKGHYFSVKQNITSSPGH